MYASPCSVEKGTSGDVNACCNCSARALNLSFKASLVNASFVVLKSDDFGCLLADWFSTSWYEYANEVAL